MRKIKNLIWDFLRLINLGGAVQLMLKSPMLEDGWFKSFNTKRSVDKNNNPIPWCTYPFIRFIEPRLNKNMEIFEFGAGNSTLWYAKRVKNTISVEHDQLWTEILTPKLPSNSRVVFQKMEINGNYSKQASQENQKFDIIIVDGQDRNNCIYNGINSLNDRGVLILDNSERIEYKESIDHLLSLEFKKIDFWGLSPIISEYNCTTIFYRNNNCLKI